MSETGCVRQSTLWVLSLLSVYRGTVGGSDDVSADKVRRLKLRDLE
jgi:hypothetical protein